MSDTAPTNSIFADLATERVLTNFFERMPLIGVGLDTQGAVTYINPYFLTLTGYTREEVIGKNWFTTFIPKAQETMLTNAFTDILAKESYTRLENAILTKSGELLADFLDECRPQRCRGETLGNTEYRPGYKQFKKCGTITPGR